MPELTLGQRFWRFLGFHGADHPMPQKDRTEAANKVIGDDFDEIVSDVHIYISFCDHLRILVSGRAQVLSLIVTDTPVNKATTYSAFGVLRPGTKMIGPYA